MRRQSEHFDDYAGGRGAAAGRRPRSIPCFCTRKEIAADAATRERETGEAWPRDPDGAPLYSGRCRLLPPEESERRIAAGEGACLAPRRRGGAPVRRAPCPTGASTAKATRSGSRRSPRAGATRSSSARRSRRATISRSWSDDALQGVTHVVRGADLEAATDLHVLLQALLGVPDAALPPPPAPQGRGRGQAVQEPAIPVPRRAPGGGRDARRRSGARSGSTLSRRRAPEARAGW